MSTLPLPLPPVPQVLRELLKDYPEHIQTLQDDLVRVMSDTCESIPLFERAVWMIKDALSAFISDAQDEVNVAEAAGDTEALARAKEKKSLMFDARSSAWLIDDDFGTYFQAPKFEGLPNE